MTHVPESKTELRGPWNQEIPTQGGIFTYLILLSIELSATFIMNSLNTDLSVYIGH